MTKKFLLLSAMLVACTRADSDAPRPQMQAPDPGPDLTGSPTQVITAELTHAPEVPRRMVRKHPARVIVNLEVREVEKQIAPGVTYTLWTFGGEVPGKMIRVRQGDVVELHLGNHPSSKMPHNIDLHAVNGPGGGAEGTFTAPGKQTQITFRATNPGLYVYHCATAPVPMHVANGMYGLILVEPPDGFGYADREFYVMQGELYTSGKYHEQGHQTFDMDKGIDERPTYVVFNGAEGSLVGDKALHARVGEKIRIFVGNGGPNLTSSFHVIGEIFDKVYSEGGSKVQENVQTTVIPAGGAAIVEFTVNVAGKYSIVDHALFRAFNKGAVAQLVVDGPPMKEVYSGKQAEVAYAGAAETPVLAAEVPAAGDVGQATYARICAACHQPTGLGLPGTYPPLAGSDYLASSPPEKLIGHVLHGLQGPVTVNGNTFNGVMPPMNFLSDAEIAGALTFARASWGNKLAPVKPDQVQRVRTQSASAP